MKKMILAALTAATALVASAWWQPQDVNPSIAGIYTVMGNFATEGYNDALSELTYDCYPSGEKAFTRRFQVNINEHSADSVQITSELRRAVKGFDRVLASLPHSPKLRKLSRDSDGTLLRAYVKSANNVISNNGDGYVGFTDSTEGAMLRVKNGHVEMAQTFRVKTNDPLASDITPLGDKMTDFLDELLQEFSSRETRMVEFEAEPRTSGIVRLRDIYANPEEVTKGVVTEFAGKDATTAWEIISHDILSLVGENYDMSITYLRDRRLLTLQGHSSKSLMAACIKDGVCYVFCGNYYGKQPFLPANWIHAVAVKGQVSYYNSEEVPFDQIEGEELK